MLVFVTLSYPNHRTNFDEIWKRDRLELGKVPRLLFIFYPENSVVLGGN